MINDKGELIITWCVEDVSIRAEDNGVRCTKKMARKILDMMDKQHDCNYGVSWETIDYWLDNQEKLK